MEADKEKSVTRIPIKFTVENVGEAEGELIRHLAPRTIGAIANQLPIEGRVAIWKEEIYFEIPVEMGDEKAKAEVETGTIAYWPLGKALCVFYGETQPYSPVNILGKITKNLEIFAEIKSGTRIKVTQRSIE
jgi:hypothetical protein